MHRRIVGTTVAVTALTLLLVSAAVVWAAGTRIAGNERGAAHAQADRIARVLSLALTDDDAVPGLTADDAGRLTGVDELLLPGELIVVRTPRGDELVYGEEVSGQRVTATSSGYPVEVTVRTRGDDFASGARRVAVALGALGLVALGCAWFVARRLADRLVAPLADLAAAAGRLGRGDARPSGRRYDVVELDAVAEVLDASAQRIGEQLATERRLATDTSHQLRTPLTALSMRLEEVLTTDDPQVARDEAAVALRQVERLSHVVDDLMAHARHAPATQVDVALDEVIAQQADEWRGAYLAEGRAVEVHGQRDLVVRASATGLSQVISTLLDNALVHGRGTVSVRTRTAGRWTVVDVSDEGPGVPAGLAGRIFEREFSGASRTGLGLAVARALTEAEGGRLELTRRTPPTFTVFLPPGRDGTDEPGTGSAAPA